MPRDRDAAAAGPGPGPGQFLASPISWMTLPGNAFYLNLQQIDIKCYFFRFIQRPTTRAVGSGGAAGRSNKDNK